MNRKRGTRIQVKLSLPVVAPLLDVIKGLADDLQKVLAKPHTPSAQAPDADFSAMWAGDLLTGQNEDIAVLLALFGEEFFSEGIVYFDRGNAEAIARACSAVRLRLRDRFLEAMGDEALESGDVEMSALDATTRKAFTCYLFLATVQELIIERLDDILVDESLVDEG